MRYVRYVGLSHVRQISAADWRRAGLNGETVQWDAFNGFAVPLDRFSEDQIRKAIEPDPTFMITNEEFEPDTTATRDMTPQQVEAPRVDILSDPTLESVSTSSSEDSDTDAAPGGDAPTTTRRGRGSGTD